MLFPWKDLNPTRTTPWISWGIILLCVLSYVYWAIQVPEMQQALQLAFGLVPARVTLMLQSGGIDAAVVATVFTSMFMHGGLAHVFGNLWFLRIFGDNVEDNFGHVRYAIFYLLCGIAAAVTQWAVDPTSTVPMVGASGAIAGVLAAYMVLYPRARILTVIFLVIFFRMVELPALVLIALWFGLQLYSGVVSLGAQGGGGVAFWAHVGGFVAGLVLTFVFRKRTPRKEKTPQDSYMGPFGRRGGNYG